MAMYGWEAGINRLSRSRVRVWRLWYMEGLSVCTQVVGILQGSVFDGRCF